MELPNEGKEKRKSVSVSMESGRLAIAKYRNLLGERLSERRGSDVDYGRELG